MTVDAYLAGSGTIFESYLSQDSGNRCYSLRTPEGPRWVKVLNLVQTPLEDVHGIVDFYNSLRSPSIPRSWSLVPLDDGLVMVHDWAPGRVLHSPDEKRTDSNSTYQRFAGLPAPERLTAYDRILQSFEEIEDKHIIIEDFYDGCIIHDFSGRQTYLCDLDHIHRGPYMLAKDRQFGSSRFMAPEEFRRGSWIDHRTNVFTMAATGFVLLNDNKRDREDWPLNEDSYQVLRKAISVEMGERQPSVRELCREWKATSAT